jgi:hypothetical protein
MSDQIPIDDGGHEYIKVVGAMKNLTDGKPVFDLGGGLGALNYLTNLYFELSDRAAAPVAGSVLTQTKHCRAIARLFKRRATHFQLRIEDRRLKAYQVAAL